MTPYIRREGMWQKPTSKNLMFRGQGDSLKRRDIQADGHGKIGE